MPELDPFVIIIIIVVVITTTIVIFQPCFFGFIKEDLSKKENLPFELVLQVVSWEHLSTPGYRIRCLWGL